MDSFPKPGRRIRVSSAGGVRPLSRPDGHELYFLSPQDPLMASAVSMDADRLMLFAPQPLFTIAGLAAASSYRQEIAVAAKGERFLFNMLVPEPRPTTLTVILNWSPPGAP